MPSLILLMIDVLQWRCCLQPGPTRKSSFSPVGKVLVAFTRLTGVASVAAAVSPEYLLSVDHIILVLSTIQYASFFPLFALASFSIRSKRKNKLSRQSGAARRGGATLHRSFGRAKVPLMLRSKSNDGEWQRSGRRRSQTGQIISVELSVSE